MPQRDRANECLSRADTCRLRAAISDNPEIRSIYLDLAEEWEIRPSIEQLESHRKQ